MDKFDFIAAYVSKHLGPLNLPYGLQYLNTRDRLYDEAEQKWKAKQSLTNKNKHNDGRIHKTTKKRNL